MHQSVGEGGSKIGDGSGEGRCRDGDDRMGLSAPMTWSTNTLSLKSFIAVSTFTENDNRVNMGSAFEMTKADIP